MLEEVDPDTAARLPVNDVRRVVRALEVYRLTGVPFSRQPSSEKEPLFRYRVAALTMDRTILYERIERRVDQMMAQGLLEEVRALLNCGVPSDCQAMKAIGYQELALYLQGQMPLDDAVARIKTRTRRFAKRQLTWFKRMPYIHWYEKDQYEDEAALARAVIRDIDAHWRA